MDQSAVFLQKTILRAVAQLRRCCAGAMDEDAGQFTERQRRIIELIHALNQNREEGCSVRMLAERLGVTSAAVSEMIDLLSARGVVERKVNPHDRRAVALTLTPVWRQKFLLADHQFNLLLSEFIGNLGENERIIILRAAEKLCSFADQKFETGKRGS